MTRRSLLLVLAGLAVVLAAALAVLAVDVAGSGSDLRRGDRRFGGDPSLTNAWRESGMMPFRLGDGMLGARDDLGFRQAVERFRRGAPPGPPSPSLTVARDRRRAERALARIADHDRNARRSAEAANLLGVLSFRESVANPDAAATLLQRSATAFRLAVRRDQANEAAKFNLELALDLLGRSGIGPSGNGRGNQAAQSGAINSPPGSGY